MDGLNEACDGDGDGDGARAKSRDCPFSSTLPSLTEVAPHSAVASS